MWGPHNVRINSQKFEASSTRKRRKVCRRLKQKILVWCPNRPSRNTRLKLHTDSPLIALLVYVLVIVEDWPIGSGQLRPNKLTSYTRHRCAG
ncbi:uncharacterized protein CANTADRAFT_277260 [Suhomyces tanzawaensis NRRL Y-17324]|uniref:Uncharacterized protein n=1 Tax=Suhomyces tanzawaensis NRRL Y-17324 TaxID=984487 RepID=A0A1E4SH16_9ASCO|nr:uncharacterized protein CANTADRAFT_277260 [Suhomyces tanzawaensis NRRL Y-17324]ODV78809.1 hypothetical protein CANTADRAFT_277260 [Suhomyces tanzawaensis NRRL Y-17324]